MKQKLILIPVALLIILQLFGCGSRVYGEKNSSQNINNIKTTTKEIQKSTQVKPKAIAMIGKNRKILKTKTCKLIKFDAKNSFDPDGNSTNLQYQWLNIKSNTISTKKSFVHKYDKKGLYEATLKVTDEQKLSAIDRVCILVGISEKDIPLIAKAGNDQKISSSTKVKLNGRAVCRNDIVKYEWKEGQNILSTNPIFENHFEAGKHKLTLTIEDKKGNKATDEVVLNVI
jgi:hypothetical protein